MPDLLCDIERYVTALRDWIASWIGWMHLLKCTEQNATALRFNSIKPDWCIVALHPSCWHKTIDKNHRLPKSFYCIGLCRLRYAHFNNLFHPLFRPQLQLFGQQQIPNHKFLFFSLQNINKLYNKSSDDWFFYIVQQAVNCALRSLSFFIHLNGFAPIFGMRCHCFSYLCINFVWSLDLPHIIYSVFLLSQNNFVDFCYYYYFSCLRSLTWLLSTSQIYRPIESI